jgi:hypothetical protein
MAGSVSLNTFFSYTVISVNLAQFFQVGANDVSMPLTKQVKADVRNLVNVCD